MTNPHSGPSLESFLEEEGIFEKATLGALKRLATPTTKMVYDPPGGWLYGFPKVYEPKEGETIEETLLRDGYPQHEIDAGNAKHCRFWEYSYD